MERPIFKPIGTPVEELDTPALVVDAGVLEANIEAMHSFFRARDVKLRPHVNAHRCPAIAHKQLAAQGTVEGICVATIGQAEVFVECGFTDVFVANLVVTPPKIARLCSLARRAAMTVAVDNPSNVRQLSEAATATGVRLDVVVAVSTRQDTFGIDPERPAVDLAEAVIRADGLDFTGLMTYGGTVLLEETEELGAESRGRIDQVLHTRQMIERAGMDVRVVSVGGTSNYEIAAEMEGVTEVPAGSYALMDEKYRAHRKQFRPAVWVLGAVTSLPEPGTAITDAGRKAVGADLGLPGVENIPGATVRHLSAEHGSLILDTSRDNELRLDDRVWFTPWDIGTCANLHDYMHVVRDRKLEAVWDIPARGRYR